MSGKIIVAVDPGRTTGVCVGRHLEGRQFEFMESHEVLWEDRFNIYDLLARHKPAVIVCESFMLYAHKAQQQIGSDFPSVRVIGILEFSAHLLGLSEPVFQPATVMVNVQIPPSKTDLVKILGGSEHRKDSYKHLRYFVLTKGNKL